MITPKQRLLYDATEEGIHSLIAYGSVQSGKTRGVAWAITSKSVRQPDRYILAGFKMSSVWEIMVPALKWAASGIGLKVRESRHKGIITIGESVFRTASLMKADGHQPLMGESVAGIWFDEWSRLNQTCIAELLSRLSRPNAQAFYSTNPTAPGSSIADSCLKPDDDAFSLKFTLDDNPFLTDHYKAQLRKDYATIPHLFSRYIDGDFAAAEGLIWPVWETTNEWDNDSSLALIADPAFHSVFGATYLHKNKAGSGWVVFDEYYWDSKYARPIGDREHCHNLLDKHGRPSIVIYDTAAANFGREMKLALVERYGRNHGILVKAARKDVIPGIRLTDHYLRNGMLKLSNNVPNLKREISEYEWDESGDRPRKERDHLCDTIRYASTCPVLFKPRRA